MVPVLEYHGGAIITGSPKVYFIYYGRTWATAEKELLRTFATGLAASNWMGMTNYQAGMSTSFQFAGSGRSNFKKKRGSALDYADMKSIVLQAIEDGLPKSGSALYVVLTSREVSVEDFCTVMCGYHYWIPFTSVETLKYAFVGNAVEQCPTACMAQSVSPNGNVGVDGMANHIAHELTEMISDPEGTAWFDSTGNENADKCAWTFGNTLTLKSGAAYNADFGAHHKWLLQRNIVIRGVENFCRLYLTEGP